MSTALRLQLPRHLYAEMVAQAVMELPQECCGLLAGTADGRVTARYPLVNVAENATREYWSDPRGLFDAVRDMRRRGIDVLAVYHSHPTSPPVPSRTDLERNYSESVVNFIISLAAGEPRVSAWWLTAAEYRPAAWTYEDERPA